MKQLEHMNDLLDAYGVLLTTRQLEIMCGYYEDDFSLSEIAENFGISKAAVNDMVKRCENTLKKYEELLHLVEKSKQRQIIYDKMKKSHDNKILENIKILEKLERE